MLNCCNISKTNFIQNLEILCFEIKQPYILEVSEQNEKSYLKYVAPIGRMKFTLVNRELINFLQKLPCTVKRQIGKHCQIPEKLICIAFDVLDNHLVSFGGYFIVESSSLYNLDGSRAKNGVDLTSKDKSEF